MGVSLIEEPFPRIAGRGGDGERVRSMTDGKEAAVLLDDAWLTLVVTAG